MDRFAEFVGYVAREFDTPGLDGATMARAAGLSRPHFDRLITQLAGESPVRFRARVLLERSAYRLIGSEAALIDEAIAAGFSSHEAFSRAFKRAYGKPPSLWRARPTRFQIDAPNDVHFHPPAGLRLPARERTGGSEVVVGMAQHHVAVTEDLVERAGRLTPEQLDTPLVAAVDQIDGGTLRWALSRVIGQMGMWNAAMADREYDFTVERQESALSMRRRMAETGVQFLEQVQQINEQERFDETFVDAFSDPPRLVTYAGMLAHVLHFGGHHRLVALATMRTLGITDLGHGDPKWWFGPRQA